MLPRLFHGSIRKKLAVLFLITTLPAHDAMVYVSGINGEMHVLRSRRDTE